jgi:hypothetical protein
MLTVPRLDRILWDKDVITIRVFEPHLLIWNRGFYRLFSKIFAINKNQNIILKKR